VAENENPKIEPNDQALPEMYVNEYGVTKDPAVVIEEETRTVLLTPDETVVIEKEPIPEINPANRPRKVYAGMWGQAEIVSVGVGMLTLLIVILLYVFLVIPSNSELERNRAERDRLERELATANAKYGSITSTESHVETLIKSVDNFETQYLPIASLGKNAVYQRINGLISAHNLVNTTGPDYSPLDLETQEDQGKQEEKGRAKFKSIYPGMYVTMTVEGSYQNLRRFISDLERSGDFLIISSIQLEPSDSDGQQQPGGQQGPSLQSPSDMLPNGTINPGAISTTMNQPRAPRGRTHGENISLRVELATYFRRPDFVPTGAPAPVN
jgi:Type II secretion system (T2SS), protein M subtype b